MAAVVGIVVQALGVEKGLCLVFVVVERRASIISRPRA